jgi:hypothetical protein
MMVALRSGRHDRPMVVLVWVLTLAVLGLGIALVNPVLLVWGAIGLPAAVFLTRIHVRDSRGDAAADADPAGGPADGPAAIAPGEESSR